MLATSGRAILLRVQEMRESVKICQQALDGMPEGPIKADAPKVVLPDREKMKTQMEALIHHFKIVTEGFAVSRRRGLPGDRIAARRNGLLRGQRRHGQALSRAHAQSNLRLPAGLGNHVRRPLDRRRGRRHRLDRHRAWGDRPVSALSRFPWNRLHQRSWREELWHLVRCPCCDLT